MSETVFGYHELCNRCLGNIQLVERVVAAFEEGFSADLDQLRSFIVAGQIEEAAKLAHKIKGASANIAAYQLQAVAADIERAATMGGGEYLNEHFDNLESAWSSFTSEVGTQG